MNFYETIQNGINYIETNLEKEITLEKVAAEILYVLTQFIPAFLRAYRFYRKRVHSKPPVK